MNAAQVVQDMQTLSAFVMQLLQEGEQPAYASLHPRLNELAKSFDKLEKMMSEQLPKVLLKPMPLADPARRGSWADGIARRGGLPDKQVTPGMPALGLAQVVAAEANDLYQRMLGGGGPGPTSPGPSGQHPAMRLGGKKGPPPGSRKGFGSVGGIATAVVVSAGVSAFPVQRILGACLSLAVTGGHMGLAYYEHTQAKKRAKYGGAELPDETSPDAAQRAAQEVLDSELPGATISIARGPKGEFMATVRKHGKVLGREEQKRPADAASDAVQTALAGELAEETEIDDADVIHASAS